MDVGGGFQDAAGLRESVQAAANKCTQQLQLPLSICVTVCSLADAHASWLGLLTASRHMQECFLASNTHAPCATTLPPPPPHPSTPLPVTTTLKRLKPTKAKANHLHILNAVTLLATRHL